MKCGSNHWKVDGTRLTLTRERGTKEVLEGAAFLLLGAGLVAFWLHTKRAQQDPRYLVYMGVCVLAGFHRLLLRWHIVVDQESRTVKRTLGLGVPFFGSTHALQEFRHVEMRGLEGNPRQRVFRSRCTVLLGTHDTPFILAGSEDREEALALAEAVSRHTGLGLSVDGGRARSADERLSAAPLGDSLPVPPVGNRIQVARHPEGLQLTLPAPGWCLAYKLQAALAILIAVGGSAFILVSWARVLGVSFPGFLLPVAMALLLVAFGGYLLWRVAGEATHFWRITASSKGLDLSREGRWVETRHTRIPTYRLKDIELREQAVGMSRRPAPDLSLRLWGPSGAEVAIEHAEGVLSLGAGLPREELEWTEKLLRRAVATRRDTAVSG